jgi:hypothetical protein
MSIAWRHRFSAPTGQCTRLVRFVSTSRRSSSPSGPRRDPDRRHAFAGKDRIEDTRELCVPVPDQEAEGADPVAEVREQVARLLGGPGAVRVGGHAEDVHPPGAIAAEIPRPAARLVP